MKADHELAPEVVGATAVDQSNDEVATGVIRTVETVCSTTPLVGSEASVVFIVESEIVDSLIRGFLWLSISWNMSSSGSVNFEQICTRVEQDDGVEHGRRGALTGRRLCTIADAEQLFPQSQQSSLQPLIFL